jgi:hypothetical protein
MRRTARLVCSWFVLIFAISATAQKPSDKSSKEEKVIHVGIATSLNHSRRIVPTSWARSQLVREINDLRKDKHSSVLIEAFPVDASDREEALSEAFEKEYDYVVTTLVIDPVRPGTIMIGPGGLEPNPQIIGNTDPARQLAIKFAVLRPGSPRPIAEGVATAPSDDDNDTSATSDVMRRVAARVASEIRKRRPGIPD